MSSLDRISVSGFKSIKALDQFQLKNLNVLVGANGVGKSNFIGVFELINALSTEKFQNFVARNGGANSFLHNGRKSTDQILIELNFGRNTYKVKLVPDVNDSFVIEEESCAFQGPGYERPYVVTLTNNRKEAGVTTARDGVSKHVFSSIKSWKIYHFHDTSDSSPMRQASNINDNSFLRPDASNLAPYLYYLKQNFSGEYQNIVEIIRLVAPFFKDFVLRTMPNNEEMILLEWEHLHSDQYFNVNSLSDGTLRFISLVVLLMQPESKRPTSILLDEPELGLHPYAINVLANLFRSVSLSTQIIVSTQSVSLVNQLKPEDLIVVEQNNVESVFRRINDEEMTHWIDDYGLGELWEKNIFGGRP